MPKPPGSGKTMKIVNDFNDFKPKFVKWLATNTPKALAGLANTMDDPKASKNLKHSAYTKTLDMYLKFEKELKDKKPEDFVKDTGYQEHKKNVLNKNLKVVPLINTDIIIDDEDTGT